MTRCGVRSPSAGCHRPRGGGQAQACSGLVGRDSETGDAEGGRLWRQPMRASPPVSGTGEIAALRHRALRGFAAGEARVVSVPSDPSRTVRQIFSGLRTVADRYRRRPSSNWKTLGRTAALLMMSASSCRSGREKPPLARHLADAPLVSSLTSSDAFAAIGWDEFYRTALREFKNAVSILCGVQPAEGCAERAGNALAQTCTTGKIDVACRERAAELMFRDGRPR